MNQALKAIERIGTAINDALRETILIEPQNSLQGDCKQDVIDSLREMQERYKELQTSEVLALTRALEQKE